MNLMIDMGRGRTYPFKSRSVLCSVNNDYLPELRALVKSWLHIYIAVSQPAGEIISAESLSSEILNLYGMKVIAKLQFEIYWFILFIHKVLLHTYNMRGSALSHTSHVS